MKLCMRCTDDDECEDHRERDERETVCPRCRGEGSYGPWVPCGLCYGTGTYRRTERDLAEDLKVRP